MDSERRVSSREAAMPLLPRKPEKPAPKVSDIVAEEKAAMAKRKAMFDAMLLECRDG
jgi:hypothetical protein